ncbi:hypothetical protein [Vibrio anguillarum]|uniref:Chitin-binding type-2 domain-containing protein n=1 Tax=Vibrio anguillarum TaxID=55601 RepID=A0A7U6FS47_VIBAN|nr:hypothetical protein [Vibrio anguillarum]AZS26319.1 hypothetical protein DYL72_15535 [Vibrio anguillarum]MBF4374464.1 hypothetical protein [Vibrio anguillarum]MBF4437722.1 hypothetical protein [Vibrio anguillarum]
MKLYHLLYIAIALAGQVNAQASDLPKVKEKPQAEKQSPHKGIAPNLYQRLEQSSQDDSSGQRSTSNVGTVTIKPSNSNSLNTSVSGVSCSNPLYTKLCNEIKAASTPPPPPPPDYTAAIRTCNSKPDQYSGQAYGRCDEKGTLIYEYYFDFIWSTSMNQCITTPKTVTINNCRSGGRDR